MFVVSDKTNNKMERSDAVEIVRITSSKESFGGKKKIPLKTRWHAELALHGSSIANLKILKIVARKLCKRCQAETGC